MQTTINESLSNVGIQTDLDGLSVGKMVEIIDIISQVLPKEDGLTIVEGVNKIVTNITK